MLTNNYDQQPKIGTGAELSREQFPREDKKTEWPINPLDKYSTTLEHANEVKESLDKATKASKSATQNIADLRASMGLPEGDMNTVSREYTQKLENEQKNFQQEIDDQEKQLLEIPKGEEKASNDTSREINTQILQQESKLQNLEKEAKEERKKVIQEFINKSIKKFIEEGSEEGFKDFLDKSKNVEQAKKLITEKTTILVSKQAEKFIEDGEPEELEKIGFEGRLHTATFPSDEGEEETYITKYDIEFKSGEKPNKQNVTEMPEIIDEETEKNIAQSKKQGTLQEDKTQS